MGFPGRVPRHSFRSLGLFRRRVLVCVRARVLLGRYVLAYRSVARSLGSEIAKSRIAVTKVSFKTRLYIENSCRAPRGVINFMLTYSFRTCDAHFLLRLVRKWAE